MLSEVLERAQKALKSAKRGNATLSSESQSSTSSISTVRKARATASYRFYKDSLTGRRKTHCQYRPRGSVKNNSPELDAVTDDADDVVSGEARHWRNKPTRDVVRTPENTCLRLMPSKFLLCSQIPVVFSNSIIRGFGFFIC